MSRRASLVFLAVVTLLACSGFVLMARDWSRCLDRGGDPVLPRAGRVVCLDKGAER